MLREELLADGLLAILRGFDRGGVATIVDALLRAGVRFVEVTVERGAFDLLGWLSETYAPHLRVGAGTIVTVEEAQRALQAGAQYLVSPGWFPDVAEEARRADALYLPGVTTPTEVGLALRSGIDLQKLFPAGLLGPDYLRALLGPYPQLRAVAVGNMTLDRIAPMVRAGAVGVALGGSIFGRAGAPPSPERIIRVVRRARELLAAAREMPGDQA